MFNKTLEVPKSYRLTIIKIFPSNLQVLQEMDGNHCSEMLRIQMTYGLEDRIVIHIRWESRCLLTMPLLNDMPCATTNILRLSLLHRCFLRAQQTTELSRHTPPRPHHSHFINLTLKPPG